MFLGILFLTVGVGIIAAVTAALSWLISRPLQRYGIRRSSVIAAVSWLVALYFLFNDTLFLYWLGFSWFDAYRGCFFLMWPLIVALTVWTDRRQGPRWVNAVLITAAAVLIFTLCLFGMMHPQSTSSIVG